MTLSKVAFEGNNEIGIFSNLTNNYALVATGGSDNYYSVFEGELADTIPVIHTSIAGTPFVGQSTVGNRHGLLVPLSITEKEISHLKACMPNGIEIRRVDGRISGWRNLVVCNDNCALISPELSENEAAVIADVLQVKVFRHSIVGQSLVGKYCVINNTGGLIHPRATINEQDELSQQLQIQLAAGTINSGSENISTGLVANDTFAFCGMNTTTTETSVAECALYIGNL